MGDTPFDEFNKINVVLSPVGLTQWDVSSALGFLPNLGSTPAVPLRDVRSIFVSEDKSPFPSIPWETGWIGLRHTVLPMEAGEACFPSDWAAMHICARPHALLCVAHGPALGSGGVQLCAAATVAAAERLRGTYGGDAPLLHRLVVFSTTPEQVAESEALASEGVVCISEDECPQRKVLLPLAAALVAGIQSAALRLSPAAVSLSTELDQASIARQEALFPNRAKDETSASKARMGRVRKATGDLAMLCGAVPDAMEHYRNAVDLLRAAGDALWMAGTLETIAAATSISLAREPSRPGVDRASEATAAAAQCAALLDRAGFAERASLVRCRAARLGRGTGAGGSAGDVAKARSGQPTGDPGADPATLEGGDENDNARSVSGHPGTKPPVPLSLSAVRAAASSVPDPVLAIAEICSLARAAAVSSRPRLALMLRAAALATLADAGPRPLPPCASAGLIAAVLGAPLPLGVLWGLYPSLVDALAATGFNRSSRVVACAWAEAVRDSMLAWQRGWGEAPGGAEGHGGGRERVPGRWPGVEAVGEAGRGQAWSVEEGLSARGTQGGSASLPWPDVVSLGLGILAEQPGQYPPDTCAALCRRLVRLLDEGSAHLPPAVQQDLADSAVDLSRSLMNRGAPAKEAEAGAPLPGLSLPCSFFSVSVDRTPGAGSEAAVGGPGAGASSRGSGGVAGGGGSVGGAGQSGRRSGRVGDAGGGPFLFVPEERRARMLGVREQGEGGDTRGKACLREGDTVAVSVRCTLQAALVPWGCVLASERRDQGAHGGVAAAVSEQGAFPAPGASALVTLLPGASGVSSGAVTHVAIVCGGLNLCVPLPSPLKMHPGAVSDSSDVPETAASGSESAMKRQKDALSAVVEAAAEAGGECGLRMEMDRLDGGGGAASGGELSDLPAPWCVRVCMRGLGGRAGEGECVVALGIARENEEEGADAGWSVSGVTSRKVLAEWSEGEWKAVLRCRVRFLAPGRFVLAATVGGREGEGWETSTTVHVS